ncbi:hypothetical protein J4E93_001134 [Alternaria ventricosa]|uniref:uncharacterized protein n=1 Tax=Alternaria ventricosa TaxID=1187951 RepID=UPI0020C3027E|nr:uncharacterized protein J4E93_001134 [Alternaria ventricosa]KAI4653368.1 hypothetical protein J4E93_001134 [Alternaria ventricosa]
MYKAMLNTETASTKLKPSDSAPTAPTDQPSRPEISSIKFTATALPQGTPPGNPIATSGGPVQPIPGEPMRPPGGLPALPANLPATTTVLSPGGLQTMSLPGLGAVVVEPSHSGIMISGAASMIVPGQQTTINDVAISFDTSASFVVIGGTATFGLPPPTPATRPAPVVIGGTTVNIGEVATRLRPGEVTTINNLPISRDTSASFVVVGGTQTIPLPESTQESGPSAVIIGGMTVNISELASELEPGEVTTINNIPISRGGSGSFVVIDGTRTIPLLETTQTPGPSSVVIDGTTVNVSELASELEPGEVTVIGTLTISRDSSALIAGTTTIAIGAAASSVVISGTTISPGALPSGFSFIPAADGGGLLLPNGQTLMPGAMTTVSGIEVSLTPGETPVVVVEGSISVTASVTADGKDGSSISSGSDGFGQPTSTTTGVLADFTGGAIASVHGVWDALCTLAMTSLFFDLVQRLF